MQSAEIKAEETNPAKAIRAVIPPVDPTMQAFTTTFLIGLPRSGTTLLSYLLAGVEKSLSLSEPFLAHAIYSHRRLRRFFYRLQKKAKITRLSPPQRADTPDYLMYLSDLARINGLNHLLIKETYRAGREWDNVPLLDELASRTDPVMAIIRHPYDIAYSSIRFTRWWRGMVGRVMRLAAPGLPLFRNEGEVVEYVADNWVNFARWCRRNHIFTIRYEDLVNDPAPWIRKVCDYAHLPFHDNMLDPRHPRSPFGGIGDPGVMLQAPRPISTQSVGRKDRLISEYRHIITTKCGPVIEDWNYQW